MNDVQALIDRQLGLYCRLNYDNILRRLLVSPSESFYGLQNVAGAALEQDPPIFACRFSEASGYEHILALANEDGRVAIQDTSQILPNTTLEGFQCHNNAVFDLAWMPRHMSFVTVSGDHTAALWDIQEGTPKRVLVFSSHTKSVKTAAFRPTDPSVFATGARDGHILVWDIRASNQPSVVMKPDNCLRNCHSSFTPKTPGSHSKRRVEPPRATSITGLVFQHDETLLSCGECDGNIKVWDLRKSYNVHTREPLPKHSIPYCGSSTRNGYTNLLVDEARVRLYASCMDNVIYCFNVATYSPLPEQRYIGHESGSFYIKTALSPDCRYLVSGSSDKHAYVWNVRSSAPVVRLAGHWAEVTCAAWCRASDMKIVTCSDDARHKVWRIGREVLDPDTERELQGRAEPVPRAQLPALPQWGRLEHTPSSTKRQAATTPGSHLPKRPRPDGSTRKTKRCLADIMNASHDAEVAAKRPRVSPPPAPCGDTTPTKRPCAADDWAYISPRPGTSFMSPTRNYERTVCRKISPRSPSSTENRSPVKVSPSAPKVRVISFSPPTRDLPNFVADGSAPHLRLMSPAKRKLETTDWLTLMRREKLTRVETGAGGGERGAPLSPRENVPPRRTSTSERVARPGHKTRTLLKYFNLTRKER